MPYGQALPVRRPGEVQHVARLSVGAQRAAPDRHAPARRPQGRVRIAIVDGISTMSAGLNKLAPNHRDFVAGLLA